MMIADGDGGGNSMWCFEKVFRGICKSILPNNSLAAGQKSHQIIVIYNNLKICLLFLPD